MKKIIQYSLLLAGFHLLFAGCDDYLSHDLGSQLTLEETFSKRNTTESYLNHVYSYLKQEFLAYSAASGNMTSISDEAYFSWVTWVDYPNHNKGDWSAATPAYHSWSHYYIGIDQATIFITHVDSCKELSSDQRLKYKSEARFLRAYYYYKLVEQYGPVYIWGDQTSDRSIKGPTIDRMPLDSCINFIVSELDKAAEGLQDQKTVTDPKWIGRVTYGAALAIKTRIQLYAARPLFNGCSWYRGMKNYYGQDLFPQTADITKWEKAALSAKSVIDLADEGVYALCQGTSADPIEKGIEGYSKIFFEKWNKELIFARWETSGYEWGVRAAPSVVLNQGYAGYAPSLKLVDTYPMASGRFPMKSGEGNVRPDVDQASGYQSSGFTNGWFNPADKNKKQLKAHNSCIGRDSRFYASILFNGMYWINDVKGPKLVTFHKKGTSPFGHQSGDFSKVGFLFRRMSNPNDDTEGGSWGNYTWSLIRLGEIYLSYAEAWKMMDPVRRASLGLPSGLDYWNKVRERAGLKKIELAYPEVNFLDDSEAGKEAFMNLLRKERMVELAFENVRYFDVRTWMLGMKESNGPRCGLNLNADTYEDSWTRTNAICSPIVCDIKHHLFPIYQKQLDEMKNMTQNYGW